MPSNFRTSVTIPTTPSPNTNPLAITINRMSLPSFANLVRKIYSMIPPISRAMEKDGGFRKPIANATPEGIQCDTQCPLLPVYDLTEESRAKTRENAAMNSAQYSGNSPSPGIRSQLDHNLIMKSPTQQPGKAQPDVSRWRGKRRAWDFVGFTVQCVSRCRDNNRDR